jgi:hypothetical protein
MRFLLAGLIALGFLAGPAGFAVPAAASSTDDVAAAQQPAPSGEIDVNINTDRGGDWWANPIWIGIGLLALIVVIALIAMASRGGTTVIKE